jgi:PAS domain S-box-containing protein
MPKPLRVLLIDDSEDDVELALRELKRNDYAPDWRRVDSPEALRIALVDTWELVLCDWRLADFGIGEALAILRAARLEAPIIIVSSDLDADGIGAAMQNGANDYVSKSSLSRLPSAVARAVHDAEMRRERRRAEAVLRASEERFAKAFEYAPIGMALVGIDGTILKVNAAFGDMFGYSEAEISDLPVWRITHPDDMPATIAQLQRLVEGDIDTWFLEKRYYHRDGHLLWGRSATWLVRDADGRAQYVVSQVQDFTERKRLEEQARLQQAELAHVLRVATMGETVAQIAHEINQPLASIANFANGLIARFDRGHINVPAMRAVADQIAGEAVRAGEVLRRLRDFLRKGDLKLVRCDANDVVRDAVQLVEPDVREHAIHLKLHLAPHPLPIEVDRIQVAQVVLNLLRNAVEALVAHPGDERHLAVATDLHGADRIAVRVRDNGVGLPDAVGSAIFEPFFTTKDTGLGLGLSISRSIVEAHGGELWARRNVDRGATVGFTLPSVS